MFSVKFFPGNIFSFLFIYFFYFIQLVVFVFFVDEKKEMLARSLSLRPSFPSRSVKLSPLASTSILIDLTNECQSCSRISCWFADFPLLILKERLSSSAPNELPSDLSEEFSLLSLDLSSEQLLSRMPLRPQESNPQRYKRCCLEMSCRLEWDRLQLAKLQSLEVYLLFFLPLPVRINADRETPYRHDFPTLQDFLTRSRAPP